VADYHEHSDLRFLKQIFAMAKPEGDGYQALNAAFNREDGIIPKKYRELMAIAVSLTTQCPYCIDVHTTAAKKAGATREEIAETTMIAATLRAGAAVTHGTLALKLFDRE
jgi:AhpD family alkylhydroperoxidase